MLQTLLRRTGSEISSSTNSRKNLLPALGRVISSLSTLLPQLNKSQGSYTYSGTMEGIALDKATTATNGMATTATNGNYDPHCNIRVKVGSYFLEKEQ